jgi:uncharacterized membrane protein YdjX (TVP38/TMEM64 family)
MPFIVWAALAVCILLIGTSAALTVRETPEALQPVIESSGGVFDMLGYALALAVLLLTIFYIWKRRKR